MIDAAGSSLGRLLVNTGAELRANLKSISHRHHLFEVALVREMIGETIHLPLGYLQGGVGQDLRDDMAEQHRVHG